MPLKSFNNNDARQKKDAARQCGEKQEDYQPLSRWAQWWDVRFPVARFWVKHFKNFLVPRNVNYFYAFGAILVIFFFLQILTGFVMACHYIPTLEEAFSSRQYFLRLGHFGWLFVPWHAVGASFFFLAAYIHIGRALFYGSYKAPREFVWLVGVTIYLLMVAIAFFGYVLVWGQMSVTAAVVISQFIKDIPFLGGWMYHALLGADALGQPSLTRFYVLHYFLSFILLFLIVVHLLAFHQVGQGNPSGKVRQKKEHYMPFAPYALLKDRIALTVFLLLFCWVLFFHPQLLQGGENAQKGDVFSTAPHVRPEWYLLPFYSLLRALTFKIGAISSSTIGVCVVLSAFAVLFFVPWLDRSPVVSARHRPLYRFFFYFFIADFFLLGYCGAQAITPQIVFYSQLGTAYYFFFFLIVLPLLPCIEKRFFSANNEISAKTRKGLELCQRD